MKLILSGGGDAIDSRPLDKLLVSEVSKENKKILYIPIAWKSGNFEECYDWFSSTFSTLGFTNIEMWTELKGRKIGDLDAFGATYIGGGNTYTLLHKLKTSGFIDILGSFIESGRLVYGGSAGAIILGKDIRTASLGKDPDENSVNITDFSGLNIINGYTIQCHYEKDQKEELVKFVTKNILPVIALPERAGIYLEERNIKVLGFDPAYVIGVNGMVVNFKPGSKIT
jgi:dipeptidase E